MQFDRFKAFVFIGSSVNVKIIIIFSYTFASYSELPSTISTTKKGGFCQTDQLILIAIYLVLIYCLPRCIFSIYIHGFLWGAKKCAKYVGPKIRVRSGYKFRKCVPLTCQKLADNIRNMQKITVQSGVIKAFFFFSLSSSLSLSLYLSFYVFPSLCCSLSLSI